MYYIARLQLNAIIVLSMHSSNYKFNDKTATKYAQPHPLPFDLKVVPAFNISDCTMYNTDFILTIVICNNNK